MDLEWYKEDLELFYKIEHHNIKNIRNLYFNE